MRWLRTGSAARRSGEVGRRILNREKRVARTNAESGPIAIVVGALATLTLEAIAVAILMACYRSVPLLPAVLAPFLCSLMGGYVATRLARTRGLAISCGYSQQAGAEHDPRRRSAHTRLDRGWGIGRVADVGQTLAGGGESMKGRDRSITV